MTVSQDILFVKSIKGLNCLGKPPIIATINGKPNLAALKTDSGVPQLQSKLVIFRCSLL